MRVLRRYRRDIAEISPRYRRDAAEILCLRRCVGAVCAKRAHDSADRVVSVGWAEHLQKNSPRFTQEFAEIVV